MDSLHTLFRARNFKLVLGMDFGHGNTTVARVTEWTASGSAGLADLRLADNNAKEIPSVLFLDKEGNPTLGRGRDVRYAYFKNRPDRLDADFQDGITFGAVISDFFTHVMENMRKHNPTVFAGIDDDDILVLVGRPSDEDWRMHDEAYQQLISDALGLPNVVLVPESRAAIINAIYQCEGSQDTSINLSDYCIIVDHGSITTDCTVVCNRLDKPVEFSWPLGAAQIERNFLALILEEGGRAEADLSYSRDRALFDLREQKERYYHTGDAQYALRTKQRGVLCDIDSGFLRRAFHEKPFPIGSAEGRPQLRSWYGHCEAFYREIRNRLEEERLRNATIILTGGASRMDEVQEICRQVFPEVRLLVEENPGTSVSHGLCHAARKDYQAAIALEAVEAEVRESVATTLDGLAHILGKLLAAPAYEVLVAETERWIDAPNQESSVNALLARVGPALYERLNSAACQQEISDIVREWVKTNSAVLQDAVNQALRNIYGEQLVENQHGLFQEDQDSWRGLIDQFTGKDGVVKQVLDALVQSIDLHLFARILINAVVGALLGYFALPVAIMMYFLDINVNKLILRENTDKPMSRKERAKSLRKMQNKKDKLLAKIEEILVKKLRETLRTQNESGELGVDRALSQGLEKALQAIALYTE